MNDIIDFLKNRRSVIINNLKADPVDQADLDDILECGLRIADHGVLGPWKICVITPDQGHYLGHSLLAPEFKKLHPNATPAMLAFEAGRFTQTGAVLAVISSPVEHASIPVWEMQLSAGALCQNLLNAALALGYGAQWVTHWYGENKRLLTELGGNANTDQFAGFIYIGHKLEDPKPRRRPDKNAIIHIYHQPK